MQRVLIPMCLLLAAAVVQAATPEIRRSVGAPQADGARHSLRTIPEACARLEGAFTGEAATPYRLALVRTSQACQPRARMLDPAEARPATSDGWRLNDVIRVPSAACPGRQAVVEVWHRPGNVSPPKLDAQGRSRLYLDGSKHEASGATLPAFTATLAIEGACG